MTVDSLSAFTSTWESILRREGEDNMYKHAIGSLILEYSHTGSCDYLCARK
jgi:hypothetical protein